MLLGELLSVACWTALWYAIIDTQQLSEVCWAPGIVPQVRLAPCFVHLKLRQPLRGPPGAVQLPGEFGLCPAAFMLSSLCYRAIIPLLPAGLHYLSAVCPRPAARATPGRTSSARGQRL